MPHSRTCVFRIPLIAAITMIMFWLAITSARTQAHPAAVLTPNAPQLATSQAEQRSSEATQDGQRNPLLQHQPNGVPYSITIEPATPAMLQRYFPTQVGPRPRVSGPAIAVAKTVGLTPDCAVNDLLVIPGPTRVVYCYVFYNVGTTDLITHMVVDDQLGVLLDNRNYGLAPGEGGSIRVTTTVESTVKNVVTWATTDKDEVTITETEDAIAVVPTLALTATLSSDPSKCGQQRILSTLPDTTISVCYTVKNTSPITLTNHTLEDSSVGLILRNDPEPLAPGEERSMKRTLVVTQTTTNIISWTAMTADATVAKAVDEVTIQIPSIELRATVGVETTECPLTDTITVPIDSNVTLCYLVRNTGGYMLDKHVVSDTLYTYAPLMSPLEPGHSLGFTVTLPVVDDIFGVGEWRASGPGGLLAIARDRFTVTIRSDAVIEVRVFYDVDGQGTFQDLEPGIADVEMTLISPHNRHYNVRTNDKGIARLEGLPEVGNYTATINMSTVPPGYVQSTALRDIPVVRGQVETQYIGLKAPLDTDTDKDTIADHVETADDSDGDNVSNYRDTDSDNDTIPDHVETADDFDGDGTGNYLDIDSDNDGLLDKVEGMTDTNGDGQPNRLDPTQYTLLPIISKDE
ncbi:MAG: hypothetical protein KDE19_25315 [Caldilineaceae bacterium]|nr:hypothetical protein [Caldilineaceae bacterium]